MNVTISDRREFTQALISHAQPEGDQAPDIIGAADRLIRLGRRYEAIQVRWCNEDMDGPTTARQKGEEGGIEAEVREIARQLGIPDVIFQDDPRGATIKLVMADGFYNDWTHEGVCIPGS